MRIRVLGAVELEGGPALSGRLRRLLAALVVRAGEVASVDWIVAAVWGDEPPAGPTNAVQLLVSRLRRALGAEPALLTRSPGYLLAPGATDADEFARLVGSARAEAPERAAALLDEALSLWRGPAFAEFADEEFARAEAARLAELRLEAAEERAELALRLDRPDEAITRLETLVAGHPLRERARGQLLVALYRTGRQAEALARYDDHRRILAEELGIDPSPELRALHERLLRQDPGLAAPRTADRRGRAGNVPVPVSTLVGRDADLAAAVTALRSARVVTLTGPGGVGKTRLALAVAAQAAADHPDGAWLVDLTAVTGPGPVPDTVVTTLGIQRQQGLSATARLVEYLRPLRLLLVLDNCEHVAGAAARLVTAVTGGCPGVTLLVTSREPLGADGEHVLPVRPLPVPPPEVTDPSAIGESPAVRLFVERAGAAAPGFVLDAGNATAVAALCRGLDGLPLALELAAPRLRSMTPAEIVDRLDARFGLLGSGRTVALGRHRTLRAVVDWSYELLGEAERAVFERLSVFAGAFTLAAAEAVCGDDPDVAGVIADLVDRSMLAADASATPTRYVLLETLRAYGRERLAAGGGEQAARRAHAEHAVAVAEAAEVGLRGPDEARWTDELVRATADLRAAHTWALDHDLDLAARLSAALVWFAKFHLPPEVPLWAEQVAEAAVRGGVPLPRAPAVLAVAAAGARTRGDFARAAELAGRVPDIDGDPELRYPLMVRSGLALFHGRLDDADRLAAHAARLARDAGDPAWAAHAIVNRAMAAVFAGDPARARGLAAEAEAVAVASGNPTVLGWACYAAGEATAAGEHERAIALLTRARTLAESVHNRYLAGVALVALAALHGRHRDPAAALPLFAEVVEHWHRSGNRTQQWTTLRNVVELLVRLGADAHAAVLDAAVESRTTAAPAFGDVAERLARARAALRERLGPQTAAAAAARGAALADEDVVALARDMIAEVGAGGGRS